MLPTDGAVVQTGMAVTAARAAKGGAVRSYLWKDSHDAARLSLHAIAAVASMKHTLPRSADGEAPPTRRPPQVTMAEMTPAPGCNGTTMRTITPGSGKEITKGSTATVHATGVVKESGQKFWSTKDPGQEPFTYQAGVGGVIKGWDQGCLGMKVGEARELIIPAHEGYGASGFPAWGIPPGGTLNFTLECLKVE